MVEFKAGWIGRTLAVAAMSAGLGQGAMALEDASVILETNASTCEVGLQVAWTADQFRVASINEGGSTGDNPLISTSAAGNLRSLGIETQTNGTSKQVMDEIVAGLPNGSSACEDGLATPTGTLASFFADYPAGNYPFVATSIFFDVTEAQSTLSHVIPAAADIERPRAGERINRFFGLVRWDKVERLIPTFPDAYTGTGITDGSVDIVGFDLKLDRVSGDGSTTTVLEAETRQEYFWLPSTVLNRRSNYELTVTQIDASGNRTSTTVPFRTR